MTDPVLRHSVAAHDTSLNGRQIIFVINELRWFFTHRIALATAARRAGAHVAIAAPPSPLAAHVQAEGFEFHAVDLPRNLHSYVAEAKAFRSLVGLYRHVRPDLVHHVTTKPVLYGSHAARLIGVPAVVNTIAGLGYVFMSDAFRARVLRLGVRAAYRVALAHPNSRTIFQNPDDRAVFLRQGLISRDRAVLVRGSGVDTRRFVQSPEPGGVPIVMLVSRLLWDKGVGDFVEAARLVHQASQGGARFVLVGSPDPGNPTSIPENIIRDWVRDGVIEWWGEMNDIPRVMAKAALVVLPSYREGLPKVLLEAAASGRAVITNDVPGCREAVLHNETGLVVQPRDPVALAAAVQALLADPAARRRMAENGRQLVLEHFSEDIVVGAVLDIYRSLVARL